MHPIGNILRVFENRVLRRIFGPKSGEAMGEWRKPHEEALRDLYSLPSIVRMMKSRRMRWTGHVAEMGRRRTRILLVGKLERMRPVERSKLRRVDNIKMDLGEIGLGNICWILLT
jgi:hypothetical protein